MTEPLPCVKAGRPAALRALLLVLLYSLPVVLAVRPITDPDVWSHLRHGQWIVEHRAVPLVDAFSRHGSGKRWIAYSWLFEVLVYGLYEGLGLLGLVLYTAGFAVLVTWALHRLMNQVQPDPAISCILSTGGILAMAPLLIHPRPWLPTIVFFIVEIELVLKVRQGGERWPLLLLPPLFVFWANVHIQFVYGLFALGVAAVEPLIEGDEGGDLRSRRWRVQRMLGLLALCGLATLVNPYGVRIYLAVYDTITVIHPSLYLQEFQAPQFHSIFDWIMLAVTLGGVFVLGRQGTVRAWPGLLLASAVVLAFRTARDVWFGVVAALIVLVTHLPRGRESARRLSGRWLLGVATAVAVVAVASVSVRAGRDRLEAAVAETFPSGAAAAIERRGVSGSIYNHYDWGGYLMWRLPGLLVSIDGRAPLHGDARILRSVATWAGQEGWATDPELLEAAAVIGERKSALVSLLRGDARFELAYEDGIAAVFIPRR
jgi:hypothetical protein